MGSENEHLFFFSHTFPCLNNSSDYENEINNDFKGNEISLISEISIHPLVKVF